MIGIAKPVIGEEEKKAVIDVIDSGMLAQGPKVKEFEEKFASFCGTNYAVAVNSGTAALHAALHAAGIKEGDEVITVPFTFVATANPILMEHAKIIFVDVDKETFCIDPEKVKEKITENTKAIIAVDLYGQAADYDGLKKIAEEKGIKIIEDACQAVGAELNGVKAGKLGDIGCFSLYATKNMMSGEGGVITTDNEEYAELCKRFRHHGQSEKTRYEYHDIGYNYRMMDLQAAIALEQLKKVDGFNTKRIENAKILVEGLSKIKGVTLPKVKENAKHVYHQFTIKVEEDFCCSRDELIEKLKGKGIGSAIFYPKPLHLHPHFAKMGYNEGDFPVSERLAKQVLSLPVHPSLTKEEVESVVKAFEEIQNE